MDPDLVRMMEADALGVGLDPLGADAAFAGPGPAPLSPPDLGAAAAVFEPAGAQQAGGGGDDGVASSGTDTDSDGETIKKATAKKRVLEAGKRKRAGGKGVTMKLLVDHNMLKPGEDVLSCDYKGTLSLASLSEDGVIIWRGKRFESPSAWSIFLKRLVNPDRKADDGWKTIKYQGRLLEFYKSIFLARLAEEKEEEEEDPVISDEEGTGDKTKTSTGGQKIRIRGPKRAPPAEGEGGVGGGWDDFEAEVMGAPVPARTAYAKSRPVRSVKRIKWSEAEHDMQDLLPYQSSAGSGLPGAQPFRVAVSPCASFLMDLHAHMSTDEVIGLLGGTWDSVAGRIVVLRAFHVMATSTEDDSINVEMDPVSQMEVVERIRAMGLQVVGWYHSHPIFRCLPSGIDVENQLNYQKVYGEGGMASSESEVPFIGAIVGPYAEDLPGTDSELAWFHVDTMGGARNAMRVDTSSTGGALEGEVVAQVKELSGAMALTGARVEWEQVWRGGMTRREKMRKSLETHLPVAEGGMTDEARAGYVANVIRLVELAWYPGGGAAMGAGGGL